MDFHIPAMSCGHCASVITQTVQQLDAQATVIVDLPTHQVTVHTAQDRQTVAQALAEAGYPPN